MTDRDAALRILVLARFDGANASVIRDFLFSFHAHSRHAYYYIFDCRTLGEQEDLSAFDVILIFWTVHLLGPDLPPGLRDRIRATPAAKVLFLQDEYRDVRATNRMMAELGVTVMFTCVAPGDHDVFYPRALVPTLEATYTVLPGYVPAYLEAARVDPAGHRSVDIAYRSRAVPYYLGDLGHAKRRIAEVFDARSAACGLRADVSVREEDRLYGRSWLRFLREARCLLGSPSGASVVDFTGEIRRECELYLKRRPDATYAEVKERFFADQDWKVVIDTVSSRVFEAAALRCTLVLYEGAYAGILEPDVHYIPVRQDFSNVADVIDRVKDPAFCRALADRAHRDLVASGTFGYRAFAERFDAILDRHVTVRPGTAAARVTFYAARYLRRGQAIVPWKHGFVTLPSRALAWQLAGRALRAVGRRGRGRILSRLVQDPRDTVGKAMLLATALRRRPARRLLRRCLGDPGLRSTLDTLLEDIVKLDVLRRTLAGRLVSRIPFRVVSTVDDDGVLTFTSVAGGSGGAENGAGEPGRDLAAVLPRGPVSRIIWDHSALGLEVTSVVGSRVTSVGVGVGGVHGFPAIAAVMRRLPAADRAPTVLDLLGHRADGRH